MRVGNMHLKFINAMVRSMYDWEAAQVQRPDLCSEKEMLDFYMMYMGCPL